MKRRLYLDDTPFKQDHVHSRVRMKRYIDTTLALLVWCLMIAAFIYALYL